MVERVIFDLDGQPLVVRIKRRPFGHRPRFEHPVELEPQVVVEAGGVVFEKHGKLASGIQSSCRETDRVQPAFLKASLTSELLKYGLVSWKTLGDTAEVPAVLFVAGAIPHGPPDRNEIADKTLAFLLGKVRSTFVVVEHGPRSSNGALSLDRDLEGTRRMLRSLCAFPT